MDQQEQNHTDRWFDALAGAGPAADDGDRRMITAVRRAAGLIDDGPADEMGLKRLMKRLEREKLLQPERPRWQQWAPQLATAAVLIMALAVMLEWAVHEPYEHDAAMPPAAVIKEEPAPSSADLSEDKAEQPEAGRRPEARVHQAPAIAAPQQQLRMRDEAPDQETGRSIAAPQRSTPGSLDRQFSMEAQEPVPEYAIVVEDPEQVYNNLQSLADKTGGLQVEAMSDGMRLVDCVTAKACEALYDWLAQYPETEAIPRVSQMRLRFMSEAGDE